MRRRTFLALSGASVAALPLASWAQGKKPVIGFVGLTTAAEWSPYVQGFRAGLKDAGFVEGRDVEVDYKWADGRYDRLPGILAEFIKRPVDVIVPVAPPAVRAAKAATASIPIVFFMGSDPVALNIVSNLNRPEANITGATVLANFLGPKRLELLREILPDAAEFGLLVNPTNQNAAVDTAQLKQAADAAGVRVLIAKATQPADIGPAFKLFAESKIKGVIVNPDPFLLEQRKQVTTLARLGRIATIFHLREPVVAGGLMSYGASFVEGHHTAGLYAGRILKGAKPSDLPITQPTKFELAINVGAAKAIGLALPTTLLARADEVIE